MVRPRVFFDIAIDGSPVGRVIFELFSDTAPKTCENFRALCTGEKGLSALSQRPLYYKDSIIHRSIKGFMIQGGDFTKRNGTGGESIYGGTFADEDLTRALDSEGLLCMANKGPNTNGSQFFVTLRECPHLNGKHVVFGRVLRGYAEVVEKIVDVPVDEKDRPSVPVTIGNCGELVLRAKPVSQQPQLEAVGSDSESDRSENDDKRRSRKKRRRHRSESRDSDPDASGDDARERQHRKKSKRKSKLKNKSERTGARSSPRADGDQNQPQSHAEPEEETEEQYDARLEREENERLEAARKKELERLRRKLEHENAPSTNGVRFKGRGRMKYVDPEMRAHRDD
ncbi:uncharacterized protein FIBRA_06871 [Fibroporia radiculosa]|uniref:Peptidyl-prolyl cis-trans isomerase D n=1 Tax=Fibroporia radiculosa TaxID=599839 RepID=J4GTR8_9APHY|nr:uncharacterized protein FIBRA_06871 [Fibroporia radiculosa]CCM04685.1 predicted protein [Fibroporia radiculosa]